MLGHSALGRVALGEKEASSAAFAITAEAGSYVITGGAINQGLSAGAGVYAIIGNPVALRTSIGAGVGTYTISGQSVTTKATRRIVAAAASYAISGANAVLTLRRAVPANAGSYSVSGQDTDYSIAYAVKANAGTYSITGSASGLKANRRIVVGSTIENSTHFMFAALGEMGLGQSASSTSITTYAITGNLVTLRRAYPMPAGAGSYILSGQNVDFTAGKILGATTGSYAISGAPVALNYVRSISAATGAYTVGGQTTESARTLVTVNIRGLSGQRAFVAGAKASRVKGSASPSSTGTRIRAA